MCDDHMSVLFMCQFVLVCSCLCLLHLQVVIADKQLDLAAPIEKAMAILKGLQRDQCMRRWCVVTRVVNVFELMCLCSSLVGYPICITMHC